MRAIVTSLIAFAALALAGPIKAADEFDIEGLYRTTPQPTADPKKVEVLEIFWYRCPHSSSNLTSTNAPRPGRTTWSSACRPCCATAGFHKPRSSMLPRRSVNWKNCTIGV